MKNNLTCEHKFVHLDNNIFVKKVNDYGAKTYHKIDNFFCEKCLEEKSIKKEWSNYGGLNESAPDWVQSYLNK